MRKDLRIGLGIGGVLLAVLIVSLIVRSNNKKHDTGGQEVAQADGQNPYGDDATAPADPATPAADPTADPAAPVMPPMPTANGGATPPADETGDPFAKPTPIASGAPPAGAPRDWNFILARERSENPAPAAPRRSVPSDGRGSDVTPAQEPTTANARAARADGSGTERVGSSIFTGSRTPGERSHVVKSGETLSSIARAHYGNPRHYVHILKANPSVDAETMKPGTRLVLPDPSSIPTARRGGDGTGTANGTGGAFEAAATGANTGLRPVDPKLEYRIQSGDSLARISQRLYGAEDKVDALYNANRDAIGPDREKLKVGMVLRLPEPPAATAMR